MGVLLRSVCAAATAGLLSASAAASPFPDGLFSNQAGCPTTDIHAESQPTLLNARGMEAIEWNCEFVEIRPVYDGIGWLIDAVCNEPGEYYPQQIVVVADDGDSKSPGRLRVSDGGQGAPSSSHFHRCPEAG